MNELIAADAEAIVEGLSKRSHRALVLVDADGEVVWANDFCSTRFPGTFPEGHSFHETFQELFEVLPAVPAKSNQSLLECTGPTSTLVRPRQCAVEEASALEVQSGPRVYRYESFVASADGLRGGDEADGQETAGDRVLHSLLDVSHEMKVEKDFFQNLRELTSMKEIVDILYESLSTQDVIHIILVGVTSQMGLGLNRAFFLQAKRNRLKGRIGIGPSDPEEAHQIWSRIAERNFSSLREVFENLVLAGGISDVRTQELAVSLDIDLGELREAAGEAPRSGLAGAIATGRPTRLHADEPGQQADAGLFELLRTDMVAVVPLSVQGELAGVIIADNNITRQPISRDHLNALKTFAWYAAMALERSRLYEELQESVTQLRKANETLKSNQQRLLQAEKLSAVGELAASVSHEIRTPLVAIGGLARSLLQDPIEDPEMRESLGLIGNEVTRLERFLGETLDFVKPKPVETITVHFQGEIRACLATFGKEIQEHGIELRTDLPEKEVFCRIDPNLLHHTLNNLVKNAIEAMENGGALHVGLEREGLFAILRVGDTGAGIPVEVQARIFDPYFTTKTGGTGLGLAIAAQAVRGSGGRLELEDAAEYETLFKLVLPLEEVLAENGAVSAETQSTEEIFARRLS